MIDPRDERRPRSRVGRHPEISLVPSGSVRTVWVERVEAFNELREDAARVEGRASREYKVVDEYGPIELQLESDGSTPCCNRRSGHARSRGPRAALQCRRPCPRRSLVDRCRACARALPGRDDISTHLHGRVRRTVFRSVALAAGFGTKLQNRGLDELRNQGFQDAVLWVLEDNSAARAFYEATGWKFDKRDPSYRDFNAACIRYRRLL